MTQDQPERTLLSWERTALALVVNGVLLVVRHSAGLLAQALAFAGFLAALGCLVLAVRRGRALRAAAPGAPVRSARGSIMLLGGVVVLFGLGVVAFVVLQAVIG